MLACEKSNSGLALHCPERRRRRADGSWALRVLMTELKQETRKSSLRVQIFLLLYSLVQFVKCQLVIFLVLRWKVFLVDEEADPSPS